MVPKLVVQQVLCTVLNSISRENILDNRSRKVSAKDHGKLVREDWAELEGLSVTKGLKWNKAAFGICC